MPTLARHVTRQRAASDISIQIAARVANLAMGVVVTALVVRTLGNARYGQWSTIFIVLGLIGFFASFGMEEIALREAARKPEHEFEWIGAVMALRLMVLAPVMICSLIAVLVLHQSHEMLIAGVIMVVVMPFGGIGAIGLIFQLRVDNRIPMVVLTIKSVSWGIAVVIIYLTHGAMLALAISLVSTNLAASSFQAIMARRVAGGWPRPSRKRVKPLFRTSLPVGISGALIIAYARIDQVIVYSVKGPRAAGWYGSVYTLLDSSHFIPGAILTTMAPVIAAAWPRDPARLMRAARTTAELLCVGSFGALAFACVAASPVVRLIFGQEFVRAAPALPVLGASFILICFGYLNGNLMMAMGLQNKMLKISVLALVVNVVGNLILVPRVGFMGAAWMTFATELVVLVATSRLIFAELGLGIPRPGRIGRTAIAAVVLGLLLAGLRVAGAPLGVLMGFACLAYPALLLGLRAIGPEDIRTVLRKGAPA